MAKLINVDIPKPTITIKFDEDEFELVKELLHCRAIRDSASVKTNKSLACKLSNLFKEIDICK